MRYEIEIRVAEGSPARQILFDIFYPQPLLFDERELDKIYDANESVIRRDEDSGWKKDYVTGGMDEEDIAMLNLNLQVLLFKLKERCDSFRKTDDITYIINSKRCTDELINLLIKMTRPRASLDGKYIAPPLQMVVIREGDNAEFFAGGDNVSHCLKGVTFRRLYCVPGKKL